MQKPMEAAAVTIPQNRLRRFPSFLNITKLLAAYMAKYTIHPAKLIFVH